MPEKPDTYYMNNISPRPRQCVSSCSSFYFTFKSEADINGYTNKVCYLCKDLFTNTTFFDTSTNTCVTSSGCPSTTYINEERFVCLNTCFKNTIWQGAFYDILHNFCVKRKTNCLDFNASADPATYLINALCLCSPKKFFQKSIVTYSPIMVPSYYTCVASCETYYLKDDSSDVAIYKNIKCSSCENINPAKL